MVTMAAGADEVTPAAAVHTTDGAASVRFDASHPIGILSGSGSLPREIAHSVVRQGGRVEVVALPGAPADEAAGVRVTRVAWGEVGRIVATFKAAGVRDLVIIGAVERPDLWRLRPDLGLVLRLPHILRMVAAGGDDSVLRTVVRVFERDGFRVRAPDEVAPEIVGRAGAIAGPATTPGQRRDCDLGFAVVAALAPFDVGQAVVVANGAVIAIEGAEGTDRLLRRVAGRPDARGGVLVKRAKPTQDFRVDLPAIGPDTVTRASEAGLTAIGIEADRVLVAERDVMAARSSALGIAIEGRPAGVADDRSGTAAPRQGRGGAARGTAPAFWRVLLDRHVRAIDDAAMGRAVLATLADVASCRAVVVSRRHVLAIATGEPAQSLLARVGVLRQWGDARRRARRGVLVIRDGRLEDDVLDAAAAAGLEAIAIADAAALPEQHRRQAAARGLIVLPGDATAERP